MPRFLLILFLSGTAVSCGEPVENSLPHATADPWESIVFGSPVQVPLLDPFQGRWKFDFERTMAVWKAQGVADRRIKSVRDFAEKNRTMEIPPDVARLLKSEGRDPQEWRDEFTRLHSDLSIDGHVATGEGLLSEEYRFFGLHAHDGVVCGKAWHHEDRFDPGDMSKCYVRFRKTSDELHLDVFFGEESIEPDDPDLVGLPPLVLGPGGKCEAPQPRGSDVDEWTTYVFVRA